MRIKKQLNCNNGKKLNKTVAENINSELDQTMRDFKLD